MIKIVELQGLQGCVLNFSQWKFASPARNICRILYFSKKRRGAYWFSYLKMPRLFEGGALWIKFNASFSNELHGACHFLAFWCLNPFSLIYIKGSAFSSIYGLDSIWRFYYICGQLLHLWPRQPITRSEQLPSARVTAFSRTSLFLERFWRKCWISFKFHKPVSKTNKPKNDIFLPFNNV